MRSVPIGSFAALLSDDDNSCSLIVFVAKIPSIGLLSPISRNFPRLTKLILNFLFHNFLHTPPGYPAQDSESMPSDQSDQPGLLAATHNLVTDLMPADLTHNSRLQQFSLVR